MKRDVKRELDFKASKQPKIIERPERLALMLDGQGDPNGDDFKLAIQGMFTAAYGIKMAYKKAYKKVALTGEMIADMTDYVVPVVPPLQGYWTISESAQKKRTWEKTDLVYRLELVFPSDIAQPFVEEALKAVIALKQGQIPTVAKVYLGKIEAGTVGHILHVGPYDTEPESFKVLSDYLEQYNLIRTSKNHRQFR